MFTRPITKVDRENEVHAKDRVILHVDLNSFFATAEQQANPYLRGKPVGITKAEGRSCVIAASVEAKKFGVKTGSNIFEARKLCPKIIFVPADMDKYASITYRFIAICQSYSPVCEVFSLDECFIDVTETEKFWRRPPRKLSLEHQAWLEFYQDLRGSTGRPNVFHMVFELKDRLRAEVGEWMTCSVGIAPNRILAKLASDQIKPDGLFWITDDNKLEVLDKSELMDVCGLGFGLYHHLMGLGIKNFKTLREKSLEFLQFHFGPHWGPHLYNICRGIDYSPVITVSEIPTAKSVSRTYTPHRDLTTIEEVEKLIRNMCEEAASKARQMGLAGRYVALNLRGPKLSSRGSSGPWRSNEIASPTDRNDVSLHGHRTLGTYLDDGKKMFDICMSICESWDIQKVRFCGVTLGMLTQSKYLSLPLFREDQKIQIIDTTLDTINARFGDYTVFPAKLLGMPIIMPEVNGYFGDKSYRLHYLTNKFET